MQKILFIAPHLSTGGLPQYLTKKIELLQDEFDIYLVEWDDVTGGHLVVQKNKLLNLIDNDKFFTLDENKDLLLTIIDKIQPDIIHTEEIPEFYMDEEVAQKLYSTNRKYFLVETSHDSSFDVSTKRFFPDKFMFVSNWQIEQYKTLNIPKILVEYPIEYIDRPNRETALKRLNLNPNKKHILHVGLFTSRKNQKEFFEYAKALPEYEFHSVGNQADNFKWYWEPLMKDKPDNLTWWNERTDVENFYQSMDLFLFTSRGTANDKETMPLVIREALSYQIPQLLYNLEVYQDYFDKYDSINYLNFDSFDKNVLKIKEHFSKSNNIIKKEAYIVGTYPSCPHLEKMTIDCLNSLKKDKKRIIITTSHCPVSKKIQELSDYVIYDKNNIVTEHTFQWNYFCRTTNFEVNANPELNGDKVFYHGSACHNQIHNAMALAKNLNIEKAYLVNYDYHLNDVKFIDKVSKILDTHNIYSAPALEGNFDVPQMYTAFMGIKPEIFLNNLPQIFNRKEWDDLQHKTNAPSNGLEAIWYQHLKDVPNIYWGEYLDLIIEVEEAFTHHNRSQGQVFAPFLLKDKNDNFIKGKYALFLQSLGENGPELGVVSCTTHQGKLIWEENIKNSHFWYKEIDYNLNEFNDYIFSLTWRDESDNSFISKHDIKISQNYLENQLPKNGVIKLKN